MTALRLLCLLCIVFAVGCGGGTSPVVVEGKVELNKKPLDKGDVIFMPEDGKTPVTIPIENGQYSGRAAPGKYKVQFVSLKEMKNPDYTPNSPGSTKTIQKSILPDRYGPSSTETREVTAAGPNKFDFSLTSP